MSSRRRKREVERLASQKLETLEYKKRHLNRVAGKNLFEEVNIRKKYGPIIYSRTGLKIAPVVSVSLWVFSIAFRNVRLSLTEKPRLESVVLLLWRLRISVINWSVRKTRKPEGAIGNYLVTVSWER